MYSYLKYKGINWKDYLSKQIVPSECIISGNVAAIYEKKMQKCEGTTDEKLLSCAFKIMQYRKLLKPLGVNDVHYIYCLNDWFKKPKYKDYLDYIDSVGGCSYVFAS